MRNTSCHSRHDANTSLHRCTVHHRIHSRRVDHLVRGSSHSHPGPQCKFSLSSPKNSLEADPGPILSKHQCDVEAILNEGEGVDVISR